MGRQLRLTPVLGLPAARLPATGLLLALGLTACDGGDRDRSAPVSSSSAAVIASSTSAAEAHSAASAEAGRPTPSASASVAAPVPQRPLLAATQDTLLKLIGPFEPVDEPFLRKHINTGGPAAMNQGNPEIAHHAISRQRCLEGLRGITLQSEEQRRSCGGQPNMVPVYEDGDMATAKTCIDIFEFPNQPCEPPFVWAGPAQARAVCKKLGKRLCTQEEWMLACDADPAGGERQRYAYGDTLDLEMCNTNKRFADHNAESCDATTAQKAWETCGTHTEPSGAYPGCRSRLGVFDLHGNVAEAMTRRDPDGKTYSQLKGSAFFYVEVHRKDGGERKKENYPDICRHDPRWHVQEMRRAWHVNYHLGFRCCATVGR